MSIFKMLTYKVTTKFGEIDKFHPQPHTGVDFACPAGTPAQSISDGTISKISLDPMLGENIRVKADAGREWVYGHLSQVDVTYGQHVSSGDVIGLTGGVPGAPGAGHSTGTHIHITLLKDGVPVDPIAALASPDGGSGWWSKLGDALVNPPHVPTVTERIIDFIGTLIHIMPEVCGLIAMAFMLAGMVGSPRLMRYAGTSVLLAMVGVVLNAAIS